MYICVNVNNVYCVIVLLTFRLFSPILSWCCEEVTLSAVAALYSANRQWWRHEIAGGAMARGIWGGRKYPSGVQGPSPGKGLGNEVPRGVGDEVPQKLKQSVDIVYRF